MTLQQFNDTPQAIPLSLHEEVSSETIETSRHEFAEVMRLLNEYTLKYQRTVDAMDAVSSSKNLVYDTVLPVLTVMLAMTATLVMASKNPSGLISLSILGIISGSGGFLIVTVVSLRFRNTQREALKATGTKTFLKTRLESLLRLVSQMHESGRLTPSQKLEADLRLAEAEMVLQLGDKIS